LGGGGFHGGGFGGGASEERFHGGGMLAHSMMAGVSTEVDFRGCAFPPWIS